MEPLIKLAREAACRMVGEPCDASHAETLDSGEHVFHVVCDVSRVKATVTLNPNGLKACVEWPSGTEGTNYKICDLRDIAGTNLSSTSEEKAIGD